MNKLYALVLVFLPFVIAAQTSVKNIIIDAETKKAIAYCNIFNRSTNNGVISNAEGRFFIEIESLDDIISISFIGYATRNIQAKRIINWNSVSLKKKQYQLKEVEIHSDNDYLYDIMVDCRKALKKMNNKQVSKSFFILNTSSNQQPLELLECYYNARQTSGKLDDLYLKNGRFALQPSNNRFFLNHNTSQVFNRLNFIKRSDILPDVILQYGKNGMKKRFDVSLDYSNADLYKISFWPKNNKTNSFHGEIWIDKHSSLIKKIHLNAQNISKHPFIAFADDSIANVSLNTTYTFRQNDSIFAIEHIIFDMNFTYYSITGSTLLSNKLPDLVREITISSVLFFYDFNNPFILPYLEYDNLYTDYRKISIIPYNKNFWSSRKLLLTNEQKKQAEILNKEGVLVNYDTGNYGINFMKDEFKSEKKYYKGFYEHPSYLFWSSTVRVVLKKDIIIKQSNQAYSYSGIPNDMYDFKVQILLDINSNDSKFDCKSYTIFDLTKTFYWLKTNEYSNAFVNIYFDLCEIERRKMENKLLKYNKSLRQIDSIYSNTLLNIENVTHKYKKEVQRGNNVKDLKKWNDYVLDELGIDNIKLFNN